MPYTDVCHYSFPWHGLVSMWLHFHPWMEGSFIRLCSDQERAGILVWDLLLPGNPLLPLSLFLHLESNKAIWSERPLLCIKFCISGGGNWIEGKPGIETRSLQAKIAIPSTGLLCLPLSNTDCFMLVVWRLIKIVQHKENLFSVAIITSFFEVTL